MSQTNLGQRMSQHGLDWGRTTVAKLEGGGRKAVTVQELLALALVFDVPPIVLIADPRHEDEVPVAEGLNVPAWEALLWLTGSGTITPADQRDPSGQRTFASAAWMIQAGWAIVENLAELQKRTRVLDAADAEEVERAARADDARHRSALRRLATAAVRIKAAGAPLPPIPLDAVRRRAAELDVELPATLAED